MNQIRLVAVLLLGLGKSKSTPSSFKRYSVQARASPFAFLPKQRPEFESEVSSFTFT